MAGQFFLYDPTHDFDRLFEEAFNARFQGGPALTERPTQVPTSHHRSHGGGVMRPRMDLHSSKEANTITASFELPGLTKEDLEMCLHDGRLTVSGEVKTSSEQVEGEYFLRECKSGQFSRTIRLPQGVTEDQIKVKLENGILTVAFPQSTPESAPKKLNIA